ncbi:UNVERIFIED_CONTAM: hypothetical protein Sangu_3120600 [Sesamum angustifolium]|uniref:Uncharacterized protein n=1 Tax=Sesamum angustifolium TaxID=2727405 RepID=A0AAW2K176_9LAMI
MQENFPLESLPQLILPQSRPPHDDYTLIILDPPVSKAKPDVGSVPLLEKMPGQTVNLHMFKKVKAADE